MANHDVADAAGEWREKPVRMANGRVFRRWMVRTHLIRPGERLDRTLAPYLEGRIEPGDIIVLSEKIVAISEARTVLMASVRPSRLARFLARHVRPLGYGLGLRRPETMEMAIREAGRVRIIAASLAGAVDRFTGRSGNFYRIAGRSVASIDGPGPTTIPPYNRYIVLAPKHPEQVIGAIARRFGCPVAVVDVNDVGSEVMAATADMDHRLVQLLMRDNPMGQGAQSTPVGVLRPAQRLVEPSEWPKRRAPLGAGWVVPFSGVADVALRLAGETGDPVSEAVDL